MQTFLPYPDFAATAAVLDPLRLGKQRVESLQILRALTVPGYGWRHHPAVKMWTGYEEALVRYGLEICGHWCSMGRPDTCAATMTTELARHRDAPGVRPQADLAAAGELPPWLGDEKLHLSHRSALLRKDPSFYRPLFGDEPDDLDYVWPRSDRLPA
ncbi:MSMEG_6728 family protein [Nonomuraea insulae]|uniref:MSMEG_6728 family protein n=1 Tax=Nonomuraea insulae TaxID=1616787 RepID=A0ABW1CBQ4_9ACTN